MAHTAPIELIWNSLDASGLLDEAVFGASEAVIWAKGDTDDVTNVAFPEVEGLTQASVELDGSGLPILNVTSVSETFNNVNVIGFQEPGCDFAYFSTGGRFSYLQWTKSNVEADAGTLKFDDGTVEGGFVWMRRHV